MAVAGYAYDTLGIRKIANICQNEAWGVGYMDAVRKAFAEKGGDTLGYGKFSIDSATYENYDFVPMLDSIFETIPDAIFSADWRTSIYLYKAIASHTKFNTDSTILIQCENFVPSVHDLTTNISFQSVPTVYAMGGATVDKNNANWKAFKAAYDVKYNTNLHVAQSCAGAYDAVYLYCYAIMKAGQTDLSNADLIAAELQGVSKTPGTVINIQEFEKASELIQSSTAIDYNGASGVIDFNDNGDVNAIYEIYKINFTTSAADTLGVMSFKAE